MEIKGYIKTQLDNLKIVCYNLGQIAIKANKRFYFNVLKREKKRIIYESGKKNSKKERVIFTI